NNTMPGSVSVLLNNGDGTFAPAVAYAAGSGPEAVVAADFNGDGVLDLAVANGSSNSVSIFLGNGDGTFQPNQEFPTGNFPYGFIIGVGDFNGDGTPDLATANDSSNDISVLINANDWSSAPHVGNWVTDPSGQPAAMWLPVQPPRPDLLGECVGS